VPALQVLVAGHHPHPLVDAHDAHVVRVLQLPLLPPPEVGGGLLVPGSVVEHSRAAQVHCGHEPDAGPRYDPYEQPAAIPGAPAHHPHPVVVAHELHPPCAVHPVGLGAVGVLPSLGTTTENDTTLLS